MNGDMERRVHMIAEAVSGMSYADWRRIAEVVEHKFSPARSRAVLDADAEEMETAIKTIPLWGD